MYRGSKQRYNSLTVTPGLEDSDWPKVQGTHQLLYAEHWLHATPQPSERNAPVPQLVGPIDLLGRYDTT